jgi:hypothetical protein
MHRIGQENGCGYALALATKLGPLGSTRLSGLDKSSPTDYHSFKSNCIIGKMESNFRGHTAPREVDPRYLWSFVHASRGRAECTQASYLLSPRVYEGAIFCKKPATDSRTEQRPKSGNNSTASISLSPAPALHTSASFADFC